MNKIDWIAKIASRKFWVLIAALIVAVLTIFALPENTITQVSGIIMALGAVVTYIFSEAKVDAARELSNTTHEVIETAVEVPTEGTDK